MLNLIHKLDRFCILNWPDQTLEGNVNQVFYLMSYLQTVIQCIWGLILGTLLIFPCTGSGAYVVIDKRTKTEDNTQETSSDDGNFYLNSAIK